MTVGRVPALGNFKIWFFIFRSSNLSRRISHMGMTSIAIKTHPTPLLGSISRTIFSNSKCGPFHSPNGLTCQPIGRARILGCLCANFCFFISNSLIVEGRSALPSAGGPFQHSEIDVRLVRALWNGCATRLRTLKLMCGSFAHSGINVRLVRALWNGCATRLRTLKLRCDSFAHSEINVRVVRALWNGFATRFSTLKQVAVNSKLNWLQPDHFFWHLYKGIGVLAINYSLAPIILYRVN